MNTTDKIIAFLNSTGSATVASYTHYQIVSSEVWLAFAGLCLLLVLGCVGGLVYALAKDEEDAGVFCICAGIVLLVICGLVTADNLTSLLSPRACAIHQLITDIRGN